MIKVLLADDFAIVRTVLRQVLEKAEDMQVVAMASNGQEAVNEAVSHCPDVVVMDISMPTMDGVEATRQICVQCSETRVLMVSMHNTPKYVRRCLRAGALGYVIKDTAGDDLVIAVHSLYEGNQYFSKQIADIAQRYVQ